MREPAVLERPDMRDWGLAFLATAAGSMDVLAFTHLANVLPSAMTGNTALLGLALGQGRWHDAVPFLIAFGAFCCGAAATTVALYLRPDARSSPRAAHRLLALEALLLVGFLLLWLFTRQPFGGGVRDLLIVLAAFAMGMQGMVARLDERSGINTIVFTSTLSAIVGSATQALLRRPHRLTRDTRRQIGMFAAYFAGALLSGLLVWSGSPVMAALPLAAVVVALFLHWRAASASRFRENNRGAHPAPRGHPIQK